MKKYRIERRLKIENHTSKLIMAVLMNRTRNILSVLPESSSV